ncbi:ABC transporter substrate-binding protein [Rhizobium sp. CG5]|uniref:ABC transporter substrate-binding protein n=1 Tax=Rhizobium sp. CG5 TaxID=2726076 RepID=UPI00203433BA|nr:ABC transporter substrate-binding protein [Rhizobium sp. CG5]MCM2472449.1 ABC transporter substrate-binding protein [Rhizobium sp. CG5]
MSNDHDAFTKPGLPENSEIDRRGFLAGIGAAGLAFGAGIAGGAGIRPVMAQDLSRLKGSGDVVVCTWGGASTDAMKEIWFTPFSQETGINVSTASVPDIAKLEVMENVGSVEWDLMDAEGTQMELAIKKDLLQKIDYDLIFKIVPKEQIDPKVIKEYGVGSVAFSTVIAWNTGLFGADGPQSWKEWADTTRFKGRRALYAQPRPSFEIALMAAGVPPEKIYPINIDDAFKALDELKPKIDLWVEKTSQWGVLMQNGEVDLMGSSLSRTLDEKKRSGKIDFTFNQSIIEQDYWVIPKSAAGGANAQKLIAYMLMAKGSLAFASRMPFNVANTTIYGDIPEEMQQQLPGYPANAARNVQIDQAWWTANSDQVRLRWLDWLSKA